MLYVEPKPVVQVKLSLVPMHPFVKTHPIIIKLNICSFPLTRKNLQKKKKLHEY